MDTSQKNMKSKRIKYSFMMMLQDSLELAKRLSLIKFNFKNIYCMSENARVLSLILSKELDLPIVFSKSRVSDETLMVTHLVGKTNQFRKKNTIVSLFIESKSKLETVYYYRILKEGQWIDFTC
jgi:hypothetical protein